MSWSVHKVTTSTVILCAVTSNHSLIPMPIRITLDGRAKGPLPLQVPGAAVRAELQTGGEMGVSHWTGLKRTGKLLGSPRGGGSIKGKKGRLYRVELEAMIRKKLV